MLIAETDHLLIRWFREEDIEAFKTIVQDPEVMRFSLKGPVKDADVDPLFEKLQLDYQEMGFGLFALEEKASKTVIGFAGIKRWEIDGEVQEEIGYRLLPKYWGKGLAFEATRSISEWAFKTLNLNYLIAIIEPENLRSVKLAKRLGMKKAKTTLFFGIPADIYLLAKKYAYKEYSEQFPALFNAEKERILPLMPPKAKIEHVGSTAVPGLGGKGIIDLAISCPQEDLPRVEKAITELGYTFNLSGSSGERRFFKTYLKDMRGPYNLYHLHVLPEGYPEWDELLDFRDYLRNHPDDTAHYAFIKKQAAEQYQEEGEKYREAKKPLIDLIKKEIRLSHLQFSPAQEKHRDVIHQWLQKPHVTEWFYGTGLENTYRFLEDYLSGSEALSFWLAFDKNHPFALFITSPIKKPTDELSYLCQERGPAITLDILIGDPYYLGLGLACPLIQRFIRSCYPEASEVLIEPEKTNAKAIHVYQKAGFEIVHETIPAHSPHPHLMMRLSTRTLPS